MAKKQETRPSLATDGRAAMKQSNCTTYALIVLGAIALYLLGTFGLGHLFGVI